MVTHSRTLAWKIPWREEHGRPQPMGSPRVGHIGATSLSFFQNKISLSLTRHCPHCYPSRSGQPVFLQAEDRFYCSRDWEGFLFFLPPHRFHKVENKTCPSKYCEFYSNCTDMAHWPINSKKQLRKQLRVFKPKLKKFKKKTMWVTWWN